MKIDFKLPEKIDPTNIKEVLRVAKRIAAIRYGDVHQHIPPEIQSDGCIHFPPDCDYWLFPPTAKGGQPKGHWRLVGGRGDKEEDLGIIVKALQLFL